MPDTSIELQAAKDVYNKERKDLGIYKYDPSASNEYVATYRSPEHTVISTKGVTNIHQVQNLLHHFVRPEDYNQFQENRKKDYIEVLAKTPKNHRVTLSGHSYGAEASVQALRNPEINKRVSNVYTYNPATSYDSRPLPDEQKVMNSVVIGDIVTRGRKYGRTKYVLPKLHLPATTLYHRFHGLQSF